MPMTRQEIFDKAAKHLLAQGRKSSNDRGSCLYRGPDGTKCAVGCLIPDELYDPSMEGASANAFFMHPELRERPGMSAPKVNKKVDQIAEMLGGDSNQLLLSRLQAIHDYSEVDFWRELLRTLAYEFRLSPAILDETT